MSLARPQNSRPKHTSPQSSLMQKKAVKVQLRIMPTSPSTPLGSTCACVRACVRESKHVLMCSSTCTRVRACMCAYEHVYCAKPYRRPRVCQLLAWEHVCVCVYVQSHTDVYVYVVSFLHPDVCIFLCIPVCVVWEVHHV